MSHERLIVGLGERSYEILIGRQLLPNADVELKKISFPRRVVVITNTLVGDHYAAPLLESLDRSGFDVDCIDIPDGEEYKNLATVSAVYDELMARGLDRGCGLIALGGGVIGDLVGFVAATFLRGIPFVQIPTTLLAQVDSSVGGKTGVNHPSGKNLIGAFWQPRLVLVDVDLLSTLTMRDYVAGLAEVVKYGVTRDREFFDWLEREVSLILQRDAECLVHLIKKSCQIKADIVERDEREGGLRAVLNYGHTFAHAVENLAGYGEFRHGEAVALGMLAAADISRDMGCCTDRDFERVRALLSRFCLPIAIPEYPVAEVVAAVSRDKKIHAGRLRMVLNLGIGDCKVCEIADPPTLFAGMLSRLHADRQVADGRTNRSR